MKALTSRWSSCELWLHWKRKGNKSGHSPEGTAYLATILTTLALAFLTGGLQSTRFNNNEIIIRSKVITKEIGRKRNLCSMVMVSMRDCLTSCLSWGESLAQWPVIFLRRRTAASWRTLGVLAVRMCWTRAGTTWGSLARRLIWSSAWRRASLSGIRNWISNSSRDCAIWSSSAASQGFPLAFRSEGKGSFYIYVCPAAT